MTLKERMGALVAKIDALALRERVLVFAAIAFLLVALVESFFLNPLWQQQRAAYAQITQQQEKMKEIQAQLAMLTQAQQSDANSPQRQHIRELRQRIGEGEIYLKGKRDKLVPPERMASLLGQVLRRNSRLQLVALETLPVSLFDESGGEKGEAPASEPAPGVRMYKHGVQITVRGSYADLTGYLTELERLPTRMFWGTAKMNVVQYPSVELTMTLYTLSLDETWLQV